MEAGVIFSIVALLVATLIIHDEDQSRKDEIRKWLEDEGRL